MTSPRHAALHVGDFFRTLVDQQHDQGHFGMVGGDRVGDRLQQHRLAGARRRDDQPALALADGRQQIHHAAGVVILDGLELQALVGIERRQVVEEDLVARFLGRLEVDGVHLDQREVALAFLGRADLAGDGVAGAQVEAADLRGRDVDVVRARQVIVLRRAQEAEPVGQAFEYAFGEDQAALFGLGLEDLEDQLLLTQAGGAGDVHVLGHLVELLDAHVLQFDQIERRGAILDALGSLLFAAGGTGVVRGRNNRYFGGLHLGGGRRGRGGRSSRGLGGALRLLGVRLLGGRGLLRLFNLLRLGDRGSGGFAGVCLFGGLFCFFLRRGGSYRRGVFVIACQISLTPRPVTAENGNGSTPSWRMARKPRSCSD